MNDREADFARKLFDVIHEGIQLVDDENGEKAVTGVELTKAGILVSTTQGLLRVTVEETSIGEAFDLDVSSLEASW